MIRLQPSLEELSRLIGSYQRGDFDFPDNALKWLDDTERLLSVLRVQGSSEIATLKGGVVKTVDSMSTGAEKPPRSRVRAARNAAAMEALDRAEQIVRRCLDEATERLQRFEDKLCEGMTALCLQEELPPLYTPRSAWLGDIWLQLMENDATRALALYLASSLSMQDRLYLLDTVVGRIQANPVP